MYDIQQEELFSFEDLMEMAHESKYTAILEQLPIGTILLAVNKKSVRGRPESLNTRAMIYSLVIGTAEHILFTKDLVRRLQTSESFRKLCRFTGSDLIPSEAAYSRLFTKLEQTGVLRHVQDLLVDQAICNGFLTGGGLALDSSHLEAFDRKADTKKVKSAASTTDDPSPLEEPALLTAEICSPPSETKPEKPKRHKRGKVPKAELAEWRKKVEAYEASLTLFEKGVADMLPASYEELLRDMPQYPSVGAKGDPRGTGRMKFWYGYKLNLLVDTDSQYIVTREICSGHVSDQRPAIVLLKRLQERFPALKVQHVLADKGYDSEPVYQQIRDVGAFPLIPLIHRNKLPDGVDEHFRPLCAEGHAYRYNSFDSKRKTIKFTRPKECSTCPLLGNECQKVHKIRVDTDVRKYTAPGRGSKKFHELFKKRTAIERVFAYLKLYFGVGSTRRLGRRAFVNYDLGCLTYNLCKFALDRLNQSLLSAKCCTA